MLQLIHQIPAAGINYQRVPPGSTFTQEPEQSSSDLDLTPRQQTLNGDEVRHRRSNFDCFCKTSGDFWFQFSCGDHLICLV